MKTPFKSIFLSAAAAALTFTSTQAFESEPFGYVTLTVNGSPDGNQTAFTPLSVSLQKPVIASGTLSETPTDTVITNVDASYIPGEFAGTDASGNPTHYLQFTSDGLIVDIVANTATTLTASENLSELVASGATYVIKQYSTIADLFGENNEAGLTSGGDFSSSDQVFIMAADGSGSYATYYFQDDPTDPVPVEGGFAGGDGWRIIGDNATDHSDVVIGPDDGIIVSRSTIGDLEIVLSGTVNVIDHQRGLPAGFSLVSYPFPIDMTLEESGIYSSTNGYVSGGEFSSSDQIYVLGSDGQFATYYRQDDPTDPIPVVGGFAGGDGWRRVGDNATDQSGVVIPAGSSIIINHLGSGLNWTDARPF